MVHENLPLVPTDPRLPSGRREELPHLERPGQVPLPVVGVAFLKVRDPASSIGGREDLASVATGEGDSDLFLAGILA